MKAQGIILAGGNNMRMGALAKTRAIAAIPVAGTYRCIDFALSNMTNSDIRKVAVLTQYNAKSLDDHLRSSKWWNFGRKKGGLYVFSPTLTANNSWWYKGTADAMWQNIDWLKQSHEPYVVIASCNGIYKLNFNKVIDYHIEKDADITIVCSEIQEDARRYGVVKFGEDGRITELLEKPVVAESNTVSCGIYVMRRRLLISLLEESAAEDKFDFVNDIIIRYMRTKKIYGYMLNSFWNGITNIETYYNTNMAFLQPEIRKFFFETEPRIFTRIEDRPPAKYNQNTHVKNSLVSVDCIVNGEVVNSLLFKGVYVGENTSIKDCIIMNDVFIGDNVHLERCIVESHSTILSGTSYLGEGEIQIIAEENSRYDV